MTTVSFMLASSMQSMKNNNAKELNIAHESCVKTMEGLATTMVATSSQIDHSIAKYQANAMLGLRQTLSCLQSQHKNLIINHHPHVLQNHLQIMGNEL